MFHARPTHATALPGKPAPIHWTAQMVRPLTDAGVGSQASFLRKTFNLAAVGGSEQLYISALGLYRAFINGKRVGHDVLTPGWTCYDQRLSYQVYDVAPLLQPGENVIDIWLADGWYRSQMMWAKNAIYNTWGDKIAAIAELRSAPGNEQTLLATDISWQSGLLPILKSGIYLGEIYDARLEDLQVSSGSEVVAFDHSVLLPHETSPVRELDALPVQSSWLDGQGRTIHDFGQNSGGYVRLAVKGDAGARIVVEHAEILNERGEFDNTNYRTAAATIEYVLKGGAPESFTPFFTFQGFRYARVTVGGRAEVTSIVSVPISSAQVATGSFTSGHALVNRLVQNTIWSQRANFIEVPTDCPQRDERLGWTGDAQVFAPTRLLPAR
jgi:alpha-L-rhamnosidase